MELESVFIEVIGTAPIALVLWLWLRSESGKADFWRQKYVKLVERIIQERQQDRPEAS